MINSIGTMVLMVKTISIPDVSQMTEDFFFCDHVNCSCLATFFDRLISIYFIMLGKDYVLVAMVSAFGSIN